MFYCCLLLRQNKNKSLHYKTLLKGQMLKMLESIFSEILELFPVYKNHTKNICALKSQ